MPDFLWLYSLLKLGQKANLQVISWTNPFISADLNLDDGDLGFGPTHFFHKRK